MTISLRLSVIIAFLFCCALKSRAEGSKELAANGGNRVFWRSSMATTAQFPYPYLGIIKVYAKAGERIYLGSSAQGIVGAGANGTTGTINWRAPDGATGSSGNSPTVGLIQNRAEEVAGPRLVTGGAGPGYDPYIVTVGAGQEGIWEITFIGSNTTLAGPVPSLTQATADWVQPAGTNGSIYITAFDVSVRNDANTAFVPGRAFLNMFAGNTTNVADNYGSFNGIFHILTKDGYIYTVNANGMQGVAFDFFVNNKGFRDASGNSSYQSAAGIGTTPAAIPVHNPTTPDDATNVTHKLFLNTPAADLPATATAAGGGTDWLLSAPLASSLSNFAFTGTEGTANMAGTSPLGGTFAFTASAAGSYIISLDVDQNGSFTDVTDRQLNGVAVAGANTVQWDGLNDEGNPVPGGTTFLPGTIRIEMLGGEVHFPLLDVERNPNGIIVTRVNGAGAPDNMIYWDDSDIPPVAPGSSSPVRNLTGQSSATNGHIWTNNFGNDNGMDSWAYIPSAPLTNSAPITIRQADLEIVSITPTPAAFCLGAQVTYEVTVRNNGPSAVAGAPFVFNYPAELTGVTVTHSVVSGTFTVSGESNAAGQYSALITTGNTAEAVFTITGTASAVPAGGNLLTNASIMRTADVTDPDATNPDAAPPTDPQAECDAAPSGPGCNNIKTNSVTISAAITNNTISAAQTICSGATPAALTGSVPGGGNGTFTYLWESSTTSATDDFVAAAGVNNGQDYTPAALTATTWFRRTVTSGCILPSAAVEITVATPAAPAATATQPTCTVATGTITVTTTPGLTYSINGTDYQASGTFSNVTPATYQVTARTSAGCTSAPTQIIINAQPATPAAPAATVTQPTCAVATGTITVTGTPAAGDEWSINGTDYQTTNTFNNVAPGTYQLTVRNAGCVSPATAVVVNAQPATPAAPAATVTQPTCAVATGTITVTGTPAAGDEWSINGTDYQTTNTFNNVAPGTHQLTVRNAGCVSPATAVVVNAQPTTPAAPAASATQPTCTVPSGSITVTTAAGLEYSIDGINYQSAGTFANIAPGTYQVTARNAAGCVSLATQVMINAQPTTPAAPAATATQPTCTVATGTITVTTTAGLTYSINGTDYQAGGTFSNVATGTYQVTARNADGCTSTATAVTVNAQPAAPAAPAATATQPTCTIATGTITVTTTAGLTYSINGTDYQAGGTFSNVATGTYQVTARNADGCTSTATTVTINAQPTAPAAPAATATQPTCTVATGTITVTTTAGLTYSINGTDYQAGGTFSNVAAGTYQVTARNAAGCTSAATQVIINTAPAAPAAPVVANVTYCVGDAATALTATGTQIKWYAAATGGTALPQPVIPPTTAAGTTTYWASQTSAAGCESPRAALTVTVFAKPALQVTSSTADMAAGDARRELTGNVAGTFTGPGVVAENNRYYFNPATAGPGLHSITYAASGGGNCTASLTFSIRVIPAEADLIVSVQPENKPTGVGDPFTYTITAGNNGPATATNVVVTDPLPATVEYVSATTNNGTATYTPASNTVTWNIGTLPPNIIQTLVITVKPTQLGLVENTASISSSQTDNVPSNNTSIGAKEIVGLKIPNVFTPNGDGYNDRFVIKGLDLFPQNQLTIINRWGNHVYEQKNYSNNWDGKGLLEGTYFYILQLTDSQGRKHDYKGYLMISR